jgi:hypothetical protein
MKWIEYVVAGLVGGALSSIGIALLVAEGSLIEVMAIGVLSYSSNIAMLATAVLLGWIGGSFAQSGVGAILGGLAAPLVFAAMNIVF